MCGISWRSEIKILVALLMFARMDARTVMLEQGQLQSDNYLNNSESVSLQNISNSNSYDLNIRQPNCSHYITKTEYTLLGNGSIFIPEMERVYSNNYFLNNETAYLCSENETVETTTDYDYDLSDEFLSCGHVLIEPGEYQMLENGSMYVEVYSKIYGPRDYFLTEDGVFVCFPHIADMLSDENGTFSIQINKFSAGLAYVTYVGLTMSIISLMSHLIVFCLVPSVRNLPGYCLASLSLSLLLAYLCFLTLALAAMTEHCANLGMSVYYFFLTSFFWINTIAFDVWRSFRVVVRELRISSHRVPWRRFLFYSVYSWCIPALLTTVVKYSETTDFLPEEYRPSFATSCWFGQRRALLVFFAFPLGIIMLLNAFFFLDVTYVISRATLNTSQSHRATLTKRFFMFMRLALIMGLTWIVGLVAGYADTEALWYLFVILNTLQGVFIFFVFSCSSKLKGLCCKNYRQSKYRANSSVRTVSSRVSTI